LFGAGLGQGVGGSSVSGQILGGIGGALGGVAALGGLLTAFAGTGVIVDELSGSAEIPHRYLQGSTIYPHIHWAATTAAAGNIKFQLEYLWVNAGGTITTSTPVSNTVSSGGAAWVEMRTNLPSIGVSGSGKNMGSRLAFRLFRNPADGDDTYEADVAVFDFGIHLESDTLGSRQVTTK